MGRKKKEVVEAELRAKERERALHGDAKRGIVAVFLFAFAILFLLSFIGQAGKFGGLVEEYVGLVVGWSRWLLIPLFVLVGVMLLKRHQTTLSDIIRYVGLSFSLIAVLGLSHLFLGEDTEKLKELASAGKGGGYVGYFASAFLGATMGKPAATVVFFALLLSGLIAAFNVSLLSWYERLTKKDKAEDEAMVTSEEKESVQPQEGSIPTELVTPSPAEPKPEEASTTLVPVVAPENIKNLRFLGDEEGEASSDEESEGVKNVTFDEPTRESKEGGRSPRRRSRIRWELPPIDLLDTATSEVSGGDIERTKEVIVSTLKYFGISVEPGEVLVGPTVTQYSFRPAIGVRLSQIMTLQKDLALALAAEDIRIEAPIPGKSLIGIEVPNKTKAMVRLREMLQSKELRGWPSPLTISLGLDVSGRHVFADLGKMPHLLIAGTTRSGKSVCINTLILSLLYRNSPEDLKLILVDPKRVELSLYKGIPHIKGTVIVDNHKVVNVLKWAVSEMDRRNKILENSGSRDLASYKTKVDLGERRRVIDPETNEVREEELEPLPQIVIIIDEMADLMVAHGKEVQNLIVRIAQMGRAIGLHLVLATQRPEVNVVTGLIKANMPARISFKLKSQIDSRTILDVGGAEKLLGNGDMLYSSAEAAGLKRIQGVLVTEEEVKRVVRFLVEQKEEKGLDEIGEDFGGGGGERDTFGDEAGDEGEDDPIYKQAVKLVVETQRVSTTYLQTYLKIGYPKAARITELLEKNGVIGPSEGGRRMVLLKSLDEDKQYGDDPLADQAARDKWQM